ncbi:hypothetical protein ACF08M_34300 [Streptomyces sp. NPDC015032]
MSNTKPNPAELDFSGVTWEKSPFSGGTSPTACPSDRDTAES